MIILNKMIEEFSYLKRILGQKETQIQKYRDNYKTVKKDS